MPKTQHEKDMQRALLQYRLPENYKLVKEALLKAGRADLIGNEKNCLISEFPPRIKHVGKPQNNSVTKSGSSSDDKLHSKAGGKPQQKHKTQSRSKH